MLERYAHDLYDLVAFVERYNATNHAIINAYNHRNSRALDPSLRGRIESENDSFRPAFDYFLERLSGLPVPVSLKRLERMRLTTFAVGRDTSILEAEREWTEFSRTLRDELESIRLLVLNSEAERALFDPPTPPFGSEVQSNFASARYDIEEAGKCLALGRWTAGVVHLMRALQPALRALEADVQATKPQINWQNMIEQIEAAISAMRNGRHTRTATPIELDWYAEAATHFRFLKDAWRNHATHGSDKYDEERAMRIYGNTRSFMAQLATRLKEQP